MKTIAVFNRYDNSHFYGRITNYAGTLYSRVSRRYARLNLWEEGDCWVSLYSDTDSHQKARLLVDLSRDDAIAFAKAWVSVATPSVPVRSEEGAAE